MKQDDLGNEAKMISWDDWHLRVCAGLDERLPYPHYTDPSWRDAKLIFGKRQKTEESAYSDRFYLWDVKACERANRAAANTDRDTARWHQEWLSVYHGKPVTLRYILAGVNLSSGYPYYFYGYDFARKTQRTGEQKGQQRRGRE